MNIVVPCKAIYGLTALRPSIGIAVALLESIGKLNQASQHLEFSS